MGVNRAVANKAAEGAHTAAEALHNETGEIEGSRAAAPYASAPPASSSSSSGSMLLSHSRLIPLDPSNMISRSATRCLQKVAIALLILIPKKHNAAARSSLHKRVLYITSLQHMVFSATPTRGEI